MSTVVKDEVNVVELVDGLGRGGKRARFEFTSADPLVHFGFETNPFADNVNPAFFFRTESHEETFILMKRAIEDDAALSLCTARSGTGKTLMTQILLQDLDPDRHRTILTLVYPEMCRTALLREILAELGIEAPRRRNSIHSLLSFVQEEIVRLHRTGRKLVLIIDEAHFLGAETLHMLRTLSNIEVPEKKLVSVLLFGEESFRERLEQQCHRALLSRMFVRCTLHALSAEEVAQYVKFRCLMAGGQRDLFTPEALARIAATTGGIPREINRLAHTALLRAARRGLRVADAALIDSLIEQRGK